MRLVVFVISLSVTVSACGSDDADDPTRNKFIAACETHRSTQSMSVEKRGSYCRCGYDRTMADLNSDADKQVARFYLLGQMGADTEGLVDKTNVATMADGMVRASQAIGRATKRCRR